jgi:hypothetical protein
MNILPVRVGFFHVDGQTGGRTDIQRVMTKVFATSNAPKQIPKFVFAGAVKNFT